MDFSILHMFQQMGLVAKGVVVILLFMSVYAFTVSVERWFRFRKGRIQSAGYITAIQQILANGRMRDVLSVDQRWAGSPVAKVIGGGVADYVRDVDALGIKVEDPAEVELLVDGVSRSMDRGKEREIANLKHGLSALATISSSAPFVGLFGTVFGIITAFQNMADPSKGGGGLATVSAGISEALLTTAVGLAVAIVSVWFYNYFITRVEELNIDGTETAGEMLDTMMRDARAAVGR
jgi:biopolymer transport protein ExbB/TolQ